MKKRLLLFTVLIAAVASVTVIFWVPISTTVSSAVMLFNSSDPDLPGFLTTAKNRISKEDFLRMRAEGVALKRGIVKDQPFDFTARSKAIKKLKEQEAVLRRMPDTRTKNALTTAWVPIGPAPIPNGQTSPTAAVSGRVTAIAIHPTNPNIVYVGAAQGGVYRSTDGGTNWTAIFDSADSLAIGALTLAPSSPDTLYVGTGEPNFSIDSYFGVGVYRIDNASTTATLNGPFNQDSGANDIFSGRAIGEIIVDPTDADVIFVASTSGLGGIRPANSSFPSRGIYRSTNATSATPTFAKLTGLASNINASVRDLAIDPTDANVLLAVLIAGSPTGGIYRSANALSATPTFTQTLQFTGGSTTSDLNGELASQRSMGDTNATFYAGTGFGGGRVYRSLDGGVNWTLQIDNNFCTPQCFYDIAIAVDPANSANVFIGGAPAIISARSTDSGVNFTDNNAGVHVDTHAMEVAPSDSNTVYLGTDGGIYKSTDAGLSWTNLNNTQFSATQFMSIDVHPSDPNFTIGGTQDNGTNHYQPAGTWNRIDFGDGGYAQIDQNAPDTANVRMYHTYFNSSNLQGYGTVATTAAAFDGNWTFRGCQIGGTTVNGITCNGFVNFYAPLERGPGNPNTIYYGSDRLYRSDDTGLNHAVVSQNPIQAGIPISSIGIAPTDDNVRMVGLNDGGLFGTSTGANPLLDLDPGAAIPNVAIGRTVIDPTSATTAYVTLSAFGVTSVWKTTNLNALASGLAPTWAAAATGLPQVPVNAIVIDPMAPNNVYVGTDIGVYISTNGGTSWTVFGTGLPRVAVFGIAITNGTPRKVRIATHGRGMYETIALLPPTAATASVRGRVLNGKGRSIYRAAVTATDQSGQVRIATTNQFGYYGFEDLPVGESYTFNVNHKQYQFVPRVVDLQDDLSGFDLISEN